MMEWSSRTCQQPFPHSTPTKLPASSVAVYVFKTLVENIFSSDRFCTPERYWYVLRINSGFGNGSLNSRALRANQCKYIGFASINSGLYWQSSSEKFLMDASGALKRSSTEFKKRVDPCHIRSLIGDFPNRHSVAEHMWLVSTAVLCTLSPCRTPQAAS